MAASKRLPHPRLKAGLSHSFETLDAGGDEGECEVPHLPKLSFLLKSAPVLSSKFRHSRFLGEGVKKMTISNQAVRDSRSVRSSADHEGTLAGGGAVTRRARGSSTHPPAAAACKQVLPKSSGVSMSKPASEEQIRSAIRPPSWSGFIEGFSGVTHLSIC